MKIYNLKLWYNLDFVFLFLIKTFRCAHYNANVTDPRKKVRIRIEANATDATYIFATLFICGAYIGKEICTLKQITRV